MLIRNLDVIIRKRHGKIVAVARQMTPEGLKEGTNLLRKKRPTTFAEARALVEIALKGQIEKINFIEEQKDWERTE